MTTRFSRTRVGFVMAFLLVAGVAGTTFCADEEVPDWTAPARATRKENPVASNAASIAAGQTVFAKQCLSCHGAAGKGDGVAAFALTPKPRDLSNPKIASQTDGSIFWKLTEGKKPMPSFEKLTTETERWQVINYVRTLEPAGSAPSTPPATQPK